MVTVIFAAAKVDFSKILVWVILSGIVLDMSYFAPLGLNVVAFLAAAFISSFLAKRVLVVQGALKFLTMFGLMIIGTFLNDWILAAFGKIITGSSSDYSLVLFFNKDIFIRVLFNLITFAVIYWPLKKINDYLNFYYSRTRTF